MKNQSENQAVCYLCSILDEQTKAKRGIVYDSPAASKKVFDVSHALQGRFNRVHVVTMARGLQLGSRQSFAATAKKTSGLPVLYAQFDPLPILTYFISSISLIFLVWRIIKQQKGRALHLIVYNRNWLYVPSLLLARLLNVKNYLDLEDGALVETSGLLGRINYSLIKSCFDVLCCHGSILVAPGLVTQVSTSNNIVCYGVAKSLSEVVVNDWHDGPISFLFGGTHMQETGSLLLMDAVKILNSNFMSYKGKLTIIVTGHGILADNLAEFAQTEGKGWMEFRGRVVKAEYDKLLNASHVGLCLKLPSAEMGATTFPSKVIEIAAQGKLVLTTKLGHVSDLFGTEGAQYLEDENPITLAEAIVSVVSNRDFARKAAQTGQRRVIEMCSAEKVADDFCKLFSGNLS